VRDHPRVPDLHGAQAHGEDHDDHHLGANLHTEDAHPAQQANRDSAGDRHGKQAQQGIARPPHQDRWRPRRIGRSPQDGAVLSGWIVRIGWHGAIAPQCELAGPAKDGAVIGKTTYREWLNR
jgi:hypothetical protein